MFCINRWQSRTALLVALGIISSTLAPMVSTPVSAQQFPSEWSRERTVTIPAGVSIPVTYDKAEKIVVTPSETVPLTLTVAANVKNRSGDILIPYGTQVVGQLQPAEGGSQFVARELVFSQSRRQPLDASSQVVTKTQEVRQGANTTSILTGAAVGSAAAAAISAITGKVTALKVLGGAALGSVGGLLLGHKKVDVVVIDSKTDLALTLRSDLVVSK
jgi:hypothetical protein